MPALLPILLTAAHVVLVADKVPQFDTEQSCRRAAEVSLSLGPSADDCKREEADALVKLHQDWTQYTTAQH